MANELPDDKKDVDIYHRIERLIKEATSLGLPAAEPYTPSAQQKKHSPEVWKLFKKYPGLFAGFKKENWDAIYFESAIVGATSWPIAMDRIESFRKQFRKTDVDEEDEIEDVDDVDNSRDHVSRVSDEIKRAFAERFNDFVRRYAEHFGVRTKAVYAELATRLETECEKKPDVARALIRRWRRDGVGEPGHDETDTVGGFLGLVSPHKMLTGKTEPQFKWESVDDDDFSIDTGDDSGASFDASEDDAVPLLDDEDPDEDIVEKLRELLKSKFATTITNMIQTLHDEIPPKKQNDQDADEESVN